MLSDLSFRFTGFEQPKNLPSLRTFWTVGSRFCRPRRQCHCFPTRINDLINPPSGEFDRHLRGFSCVIVARQLEYRFYPTAQMGQLFLPVARGPTLRLCRSTFFNHTTTIALPSGRIRRFSLYAVAAVGPVAFSEKKRLRDTRAGTNRKFGKKVLTRGVAKNPIDHPHGGRTKAIRYPRTPWGKTTKFK